MNDALDHDTRKHLASTLTARLVVEACDALGILLSERGEAAPTPGQLEAIAHKAAGITLEYLLAENYADADEPRKVALAATLGAASRILAQPWLQSRAPHLAH